MNVIGVDIGKTKIAAGKVSNGRIKSLLSVKTNTSAARDEIILQITNLIDKFIDKNTKAIGIAVPAIVDVDSGVVFEVVNIPSWKKVPLKKILEKKYGLPVFINNDANCLALGEKYFGLGRKFRNFAAVTISTGLGAGLIINDKLHSGQNCGAGEFGEVLFKYHNFEYYCSGQFFLNEYKISGEELFQKAKDNNKKALSIFNTFGNNLGKALAVVVHSIDPEVIILAGSVIKSYQYFRDSMKKSLRKSIYKRSYSKLKIVMSKTKHVTVLGAAALYRDSLK